VPIVRTAHGGLHIYTNRGEYTQSTNRYCKAFVGNGYDVDVFASIDPDKRSLVVLPTTTVIESGKTLKYSWAQGDEGTEIGATVDDVLKALNFDIAGQMKAKAVAFENLVKEATPTKQATPAITTTSEPSTLDLSSADPQDVKELFKHFIHCLKLVEIHNYDDGICLFKVFRALNYFNTIGTTTDETDIASDELYRNGCLTSSAQSNFIQQLRANSGKNETDIKWFISQFKQLIPDEYTLTLKKTVAKLYTASSLNQHIDFHEPFSIRDIAANSWKYHDKENTSKIYTNKLLGDLKRLLVYINGNWGFKVKNLNGWTIDWKTVHEASDELRIMIGTRDKVKKGGIIVQVPVTAWDIIQENNNRELFRKDLIKFYTEDPNEFSFFQGYKYSLVDEVDMTIIQPWLDHVKHIICNDDEIMYDYLMKWIAFTIKEKTRKTGTMLFIQSAQGSGKGDAFTDIICEILSGYSSKNITRLDDITGQFNDTIENKRILVGNELKPADSAKLNDDSLKCVATDNTFQCQTKHRAVRTAQNVCQIILTTNHTDAIRLENSDRRFVIIRPNDKYAPKLNGKTNPLSKPYFDPLFRAINRVGFYNNLFTYFMNIDITNWNFREIPDNEARCDLLEQSRCSLELFIQDRINEFGAGYVCNQAFDAYKEFATRFNFGQCSVTTFGLKMKEYCDRKRVTINGKREFIYTIREDRLNLFEFEECGV
jgi:hypothetical protein